MRKTFLFLTAAAALLSGCAWETYQDGSYSKNMNYNQYRPERHAVLPNQTGNNADEEHRQHWQKPKFQNR